MIKQTLIVIKQVAVAALIIFSFVLILMYIFQRNLIYLPLRQTPNLQKYNAEDMTVVTLHTKDNISLNAWYKPAQAGQPTIVYLHGNTGNIGQRMLFNRQFIKVGMGVFLLDYRGYGGNKGSPAEYGLYDDARTALNYLDEQGIKPQQLVIFGESLGTGVATKIASEHASCAVVLQSPFTSLTNVAHFHYPWAFLDPWDKYDSLSRIKAIHAPLLVLHGKEDQIVPYSEGLALYNAANQPKQMMSFENSDHHTLWNVKGYVETIVNFIDSYCHNQG